MTKHEVRKLWLARWRRLDVRYWSRLPILAERIRFFAWAWPRLGYHDKQDVIHRLTTGGHGSNTRTGKFFPFPW